MAPHQSSLLTGDYIGAVLDRNGLRPSRYYVTHDDKVIMASEVGVLPVEPANVKLKGRLQPGKMFLIDFDEGRMIPDEELKKRLRRQRRPMANGCANKQSAWKKFQSCRSTMAFTRKR